MTKKQCSELYEKNFEVLFREAQKCSCWLHRGAKSPRCSNKKHEEALHVERKLSQISNRYEHI